MSVSVLIVEGQLITSFPFGLICVGILLLLLSNFSTSFSDFYTARVFPLITYPYCAFMGIFPFSVGELMLYLAVILVTVLLLGGLWSIVICIKRHSFHAPLWYRRYALFIWYVVGIFSLIMILNCFILYQTSEMSSPNNLPKEIRRISILKADGTDFDSETEKLAALRDYVVSELNSLSVEFERDENGYIVSYPGIEAKSGTIIDNSFFANPSDEYKAILKAVCVEAMNYLGDNGMPRLKGNYPNPKYLWLSQFFSQQHMMGYYFPFSMESNLNDLMYVTNYPFTICHELSHLKGYIREDEANFIAYIACINSDDLLVRYSGYLGVLNYIDNDFYYSVGKDKETYLSHVRINDLVLTDNIFLTDEAWNLVEKEKVVETETVHKASNAFTETILTSNGVSDGMRSYNRVVKLMLEYYCG